MKTYYAIHSDKTHVKVKSLTDFNTQFREKSEWGFVQADSEGWIEHTGKECPLPDRVMCDAVMEAGSVIEGMYSYKFNWRSVVKYRPILKAFEQWDENHITRPPEKVQEPEPHPTEFQKSCVEAMQKRFYPEPTARNNELLDRLKAAHDAQKELPKLLQELRDALGDELINQLCAVPNSGFGVNVWNAAGKVDFSVVEHVDMTQAVEVDPATMELTDWRNWREGDRIEFVQDFKRNYDNCYCIGSTYEFGKDRYGDTGIKDSGGMVWAESNPHSEYFKPECFRFHSRPAKGEK